MWCRAALEDGCRGPGNSITAHRKRQIESQQDEGARSDVRRKGGGNSVKERRRRRDPKMDKGRFANRVSFWLSQTVYFIMFRFCHTHTQSHFTVLI